MGALGTVARPLTTRVRLPALQPRVVFELETIPVLVAGVAQVSDDPAESLAWQVVGAGGADATSVYAVRPETEQLALFAEFAL